VACVHHGCLAKENAMLGLTTLGTVHTLVSLVALAAGFGALLRDGRIDPGNTLGKVYTWATALTCLTALGIFQRGGFGVPHALAIVTLLVLGLALWPAGSRLFGGTWPSVQTVAFSLTLFFHMIPGVTETFTRLPVGRPFFTGPDDPDLQMVVGVLFLIFLVGSAYQVWWLRGASRSQAAPPLPGAHNAGNAR